MELVPSLAKFQSSDNKVLKMLISLPGLFATGFAGDAVVTGSHPAAKDPAIKKFRVCNPAVAKLIFDPASARVVVNQKAALPLYLVEMQADGKKKGQPAELIGQGVGYYFEKPGAVSFYPPIITGREPTPPFDVTGTIPILSQPAKAKVGVVAAETKALQIVPSAASPLAPGQTVALAVQQQVERFRGMGRGPARRCRIGPTCRRRRSGRRRPPTCGRPSLCRPICKGK